MSNLDFYHDDPVDLKQPKSKKRISGVLTLVAALIGGTLYIQTTLAANISLNSGSVEFGQGITQTVACSGSQSLTITPIASFANASGSGAYKFSGIRVDNIPTSCQDTDFTFSAYNNVAASAAQAIFNTSSTRAVVYMTSTNTFEVGTGGSGLSVATNSASSFTLTFTTPVAPSSDVNKVTVESGEHIYSIGDTGPGGGIVFYVADTSFSCGPTLNLSCNYLEAAPSSGTNAWTDVDRAWSGNTGTEIGTTSTAIGTGYKNTLAMIAQSSTTSKAGTSSQEYRGPNNFTDWSLPSKNELNQMCKWQQGITGDDLTNLSKVCTGGSLNTGIGAAGFVTNVYYWSSSENGSNNARSQRFDSGYQGSATGKWASNHVRPVRAF
ncbi:MAG: hypothetical protein QNL32_01240 [Actinomycetes bacterium]